MSLKFNDAEFTNRTLKRLEWLENGESLNEKEFVADVRLMLEAVTKLEAENERLRAALSFYADRSNWISPDESANHFVNCFRCGGDGYDLAQEALNKST